MAVQMTDDARATAIEAIRRRHAGYSAEQVRRAVLRAMYGDDLADRVDQTIAR